MSVLGIVGPVFAVIAMGAVAIHLRLIEMAAVRGMTDFVFYIALPALLFLSIIEAPPLRLLDVAGTFLGGALALFGFAMLLARMLFGAQLPGASVFGLDCVFGNTVMLGIPIVDAAYGRDGVAYLLAVIAFHSAVLLPVATVFIEAGSARGRSVLGLLGAALPGVLRNPVVLSILLAFVWRISEFSMPFPMQRFFGLIGSAGPPLALFCLGASLPRPSGWSDAREVLLGTFLKLVAMPALVAFIGHLVGVHGVALSVVVIAAAMPTGANAFLFARRFETMMEASASTVVVSTALSMVTLTALLSWLVP